MIRNAIKRSSIVLLVLLQVMLFPRISFATEAPAPTTDQTTVAPTVPADPPATTGPTAPTGAAGTTYTYNDATGLWENDYYTWDPVTKQTAPKTAPDYSYNPSTGHWDTTDWRYDAPSGKYVPNVTETTTPPADSATPTNKLSAVAPTTTATSGPDSSTTTDKTATNTGNFNLFYNASISNKVNATATSGDASVTQNTLGGNAGTGNASDMATILNLLQSVWDPTSGQIATFTANIDGNVTGDLMIDPGAPTTALHATDTTNNKLAINTDQTTGITNDITLAAHTGNATVDSNTKAGDATTGTATAVANVVNLLNSYITSGQSFVGTVNINGNLDGDILLPQDMLTQLLASNVPRATIDTSNISNGNILAQFNDTTAIKNNVAASATTGNANVSGNTAAGSATSGNANSNVTILNLTGRDIVGSNAMLVFVNVLGKWVGMIMDAPGATSAALGGNITSNKLTNTDLTLNSNSNTGITNNIQLAASSGDASVTNNTNAGNATTGNALASANIANVANSNLSLSSWFGVLFINVFGNWLGSFGVNTSAGNKPVTPSAQNQSDVKVFQFVPAPPTTTSTTSYRLASVPTSSNLGTATPAVTTPSTGSVLGATTVKPVYKDIASTNGMNPIVQAYAVTAAGVLILAVLGKLFGAFKGLRS